MAESSIFSNTARCIYIYIYSTKSIQTWNLWKFEPLWESRLFFVSLFRWLKAAAGNYPHTLEVGELQIECVFSDPSMTTTPANVIPNHGIPVAHSRISESREPNEQAICRRKSRTWAIKKNISVPKYSKPFVFPQNISRYIWMRIQRTAQKEKLMNIYPMWPFHEVHMMDKSLGD